MKKNSGDKTWKKSKRARKRKRDKNKTLVKIHGIPKEHILLLREESQRTGKSIDNLISSMLLEFIKNNKKELAGTGEEK